VSGLLDGEAKPTGPVASTILLVALPARIIGLVLVALSLTGLAACGGGHSPASVAHIGSTAPTTTVPPAAGSGGMPTLQQLYEDAVAWVGCMRARGIVDLSPPTTVANATQQMVGFGEPPDKQGPKYKAANKVCEYLLPGSGSGPSQAMVQEQLAKDLKFSECMRSHGITDFPDPKQSSQGISIGPVHGLAASSPQFQAAQKACRSLVPMP
jgi:hypothetical protein